MDIFDDKESCEIVIIDGDKEFRDFLNSSLSGIMIVPEKYQGCEGLVLKPDAGDFSKWLRKNKPELNVEVRKADKRLVLKSNDFWLPFVFLAQDVALPFYLNLVTNYVYDRMKGALRGEK
ncbi:MAG: hypothetical protein DYG83_17620, partial [Candidatus Brocadia sp. AMX2]|nr:hypothetical protein [Candidatus Brocadia sp. AMX2]